MAARSCTGMVVRGRASPAEPRTLSTACGAAPAPTSGPSVRPTMRGIPTMRGLPARARSCTATVVRGPPAPTGSATPPATAGGAARVLGWVGGGWAPPSSATCYCFLGVGGGAATDVGGVGAGGTILHGDGGGGSGAPRGTPSPPLGVWGSASTDVWAVGWNG